MKLHWCSFEAAAGVVRGSERSKCILQQELGAGGVELLLCHLLRVGNSQEKLPFKEVGLHPAVGAELTHGTDALLYPTNSRECPGSIARWVSNTK